MPEPKGVLTSPSHGEQIADADVDEDDDAATSDALDRPDRDQHAHAPAESAQQRADPEDADRDEHDRLPAPDVRDLAPHRRQRRAGQHVCGTNPCVADRAVELLRNRRDRYRHDGHVQRGEE